MGWTQGRVIIGLNCCAHNRHHFPLVPSEIDVCCPWEPPLGAQCLCSPLRGCWGWAWRAGRAQTNGGGWLTGLLAEAASWQWAVMGSTLHNLPSTPPVSYCTTHRLAARAVALGSPPHLRLLVTHIWPLQGAGQSMPVLLLDYHSRLFHAYSLQWITEKWYKNKYCCALNLFFFLIWFYKLFLDQFYFLALRRWWISLLHKWLHQGLTDVWTTAHFLAPVLA